MGTYIRHFRALAQKVAGVDESPILWRRDDPNEALYHFLASRMLDAKLLDGERDGGVVTIRGLTAAGHTLLPTNDGEISEDVRSQIRSTTTETGP